jgi:hypothetical protein
MALQPFGPWPLFQFLNPIYSRQDYSDGGSVRRKAATYTKNNINNDIHVSSGIRTRDTSVRAGEDGSCLRPRGNCDRLIKPTGQLAFPLTLVVHHLKRVT